MDETRVIILRSLIAFVTLHIFARIWGKQSIGQLTFFDYLLGITVGSMAATLSVDLSSRAWPHWVGLFTWTVVVVIMEFCTIHSRGFEKYVLGEPCLLIMNGQIMEETMKKNRYTLSDLLSQLRDRNVFDLNDVAYAILETNGRLSVLLKSEVRPIVRRDMGIPPDAVQLPVKLIFCGIVLKENLALAKLTEKWLRDYLKSQKIRDVKDVFLLSMDSAGQPYYDLYQDHIEKGM